MSDSENISVCSNVSSDNVHSSKLDSLFSEASAVIQLDDDVPVWAKALLGLMHGLVTELKVIRDTHEKRIESLESEIKEQSSINDVLFAENIKLKNEIEKLQTSVDEQEQRGRNYNLVVHGVVETADEDPEEIVRDIIVDSLGIELTETSLANVHRLGKVIIKDTRMSTRKTKTKTRQRPIIFKFSRYSERMRVYGNKKLLKGKGIYITENLTERNMEIYRKAISVYGRDRCWTSQGHTFVLLENGEKTKISSLQDLD